MSNVIFKYTTCIIHNTYNIHLIISISLYVHAAYVYKYMPLYVNEYIYILHKSIYIYMSVYNIHIFLYV